jgi:hypothetical protein
MIKITTDVSIATAKSGEPILEVTKIKLFGLTIHTRITQVIDGGQIKK